VAFLGALVSTPPTVSIVLAGSLSALAAWVPPVGPVAVIGSAAAFRGLDLALGEVRRALGDSELLWYPAASKAAVDAVAREAGEPAWWLLVDGNALHARSLWRHSALAQRWREGSGPVVAVGASASVIGEIMIDPRGGAPTTGVNLYRGRVVTPRLPEALATRTRLLLGDVPLLELEEDTIEVVA
jgi:hypothetical protein